MSTFLRRALFPLAFGEFLEVAALLTASFPAAPRLAWAGACRIPAEAAFSLAALNTVLGLCIAKHSKPPHRIAESRSSKERDVKAPSAVLLPKSKFQVPAFVIAAFVTRIIQPGFAVV